MLNFVSDVPPVKQVYNPFAIERPHATPSMLERQGSFRGFTQLNQASPFKRQLSLRVNDLPSNLERTRSHSLEPTDLSRMPSALSHIVPLKPPGEFHFLSLYISFLWLREAVVNEWMTQLRTSISLYCRIEYINKFHQSNLIKWSNRIMICLSVFTTEFEGYDEGHYSLFC